MANIKSAKKRILQNQAARERNRRDRTRMRTAIKRLRAAAADDAEAARSALPATLRVIDVSAQKGVIPRNTAARYKSRMTKHVAATTDGAEG